jgi:uncharacterized protein (DUF305 family)
MNRLTPSRLRALALSFLTLVAVLVVAGCGSSSKSSSSAAGNGVDLAFASEMIPHHTSAIAMARIAQQRTSRADIKTLAANIVSSQSTEIKTLQTAKAELEKAKVTKGDLGLATDQMGMGMNDASLKTANPFDRAFMDMMVPHHQGAIRMARIELTKGSSPTLKSLAQQIIDAQAKEIGEMNSWRAMWFGAASPAGGVPADGASSGGTSGHSGTQMGG